jgi:hypothetical protein
MGRNEWTWPSVSFQTYAGNGKVWWPVPMGHTNSRLSGLAVTTGPRSGSSRERVVFKGPQAAQEDWSLLL